jgi:Protein of unknown function
MDRKQAVEIQKHLLDAAGAIDQAGTIIYGLDEADRAPLTAPLGETWSALHFELLRALYAMHPELKPPGEPPRISSKLRWDQVSLPEAVSEADIDAIILLALTTRLQKTAKVIGKAVERCRELGLPISDEMLGARLQVLVKSGRMESAGDTRKWGHSEVRLKG